MISKARKSFGEDYDCKHNWENISVQCGDSGVVISDNGGYTTAFFEAFPKSPSCFLRGEGDTIEAAEEDCWEKYQKVLTCNHEMERRNRTDGYGYCKHCSYSSMVFEPLTKCCKCRVPTAYTVDYKKRYYCKKHARFKPLNPDPKQRGGMFGDMIKTRLPRKYKKLIKHAAIFKFESEGIYGRVMYKAGILNGFKLVCDNRVIHMHFERQKRTLLDNYLTSKSK